MAACYSSYDLSGSQGVPQHHQVQSQQQIVPISVQQSARLSTSQSSQKDYSLPLHVDCSVEYELPNQAKPPTGRIEPLLMIHPCYFRKMESQRRSPFINNMPNSNRNSATVAIVPTLSSSTSTSNSNTTAIRKSSRINNQSGSNQQQQQQQQQPAAPTTNR